MKTLILRNISRYYLVNKTKRFYALKDVNLSFPNTGFHAIIGKSGSGKTTLLNLIARLDNPSSGQITLNNKVYSNKHRRDFKFYQNEIGIIFQQYHLLEDHSLIYNVALPLLIKGYKKKEAYEKAKEYLSYVNLDEELFKKKCSILSGGEKQRAAIARAIINNPSILICDEPTGALDSNNSKAVLDILKKISKDKLVIVISHNLQQVNEYSDRIIELSDGKVINDYQVHNIESNYSSSKQKKRRHHNWSTFFALKNYRKRIKRNIFVCTSLTISIIMANLVAGFINGKDNAIRNACYKQFDFAVGTISKEEVVSNTGVLKLVKSVRPDFTELNKNPYISSIFEICNNFDAILKLNLQISYDELQLENLNYNSIYSFDDVHVNSSLLVKGRLPSIDSLDEIVINESCYRKLKKIMHKDPLEESLVIYSKSEVNYVEEDGNYITDIFEYSVTSKIVGVVEEMGYLSSNKIFYSYVAFENYVQEYVLNNLSTYFDTKITWYDRINNAENYSYLSSYSYQLYLKDYRYRNYLFDLDIFPKEFSFTSSSIVIAESLVGFLDVAKYALLLFLAIALFGAVLITSIVSFTNYSEDRKTSAILSSLGSRNSDIQDIYLTESSISGLISTFISFGLSIPLSLIINKILETKLSVVGIIQIPFMKFLNIPFLYPALFLGVVILITTLATLIPIIFSKRNSIKGELQNND